MDALQLTERQAELRSRIGGRLIRQLEPGVPPPRSDKAGSFTVIELGIVTWQAVPAPISWWIDDVALGTERIGCN